MLTTNIWLVEQDIENYAIEKEKKIFVKIKSFPFIQTA